MFSISNILHYLLNDELKKVDFISKITLKLEKHTTVDFSSESTFTKKDDVYEKDKSIDIRCGISRFGDTVSCELYR